MGVFKILFILVFMVAMFVLWQELKIYRKKEEERLRKLKALKANKENLSDETLREETLEVKAEATVRKAQNDAFEKEINGLE